MVDKTSIMEQARVYGYIAFTKGICIPNPHLNLDAATAWATGYFQGAEVARRESLGADNDNWSIGSDRIDKWLQTN